MDGTTTTAIIAADYREEAVVGKRWLRSNRVTITNPYLGAPFVAFDEESVMEIEGTVTARPHATLSGPVSLSASIDLIDPTTGQALGTQMTHGQIYVGLYSFYRALGAARDAAEAAAAAAAAARAAQLAGTA